MMSVEAISLDNTQSQQSRANDSAGKSDGRTYTNETSSSSTYLTSVGAAAAAAFGYAYSTGVGAATATHAIGAGMYAQVAPVGIYAQYAAANATSTAASAMVTGTGLGVAANCALGLAAGATVFGIGVIGYNTLIAKTPEDKITLGGMATYAYKKIFG